MNPAILLQLPQRLGQFRQDHPKFARFCNTVRDHALQEGTIVGVTVTSPEGKSYETNIKLTPNDVEIIRILFSLGGDEQ